MYVYRCVWPFILSWHSGNSWFDFAPVKPFLYAHPIKHVKKKELELLLQHIPPPPDAKAELEQYITPASIAADMLWMAYYNGDIAGKTVIDFGCGSGIFAVGAALLNALRVIGIDKDERLIQIATKAANELGVTVEFITGDVEDFRGEGDTAIMNPPFGAQHANRRADRKFVQKAMETCHSLYSLHLSRSADFIKGVIEKNAWRICEEKPYTFPIKASLPFHEKRVARYEVTMIHAKRDG